MNDAAKLQIKGRLPLLAFVTTTANVKFTKSGNKYVCKCPLPSHSDSTPSFFVYDSTNSFTCFGCQASGDVFDFYMAYTGCDFYKAKQELADRAGVTLYQDPKELEERARKARLTEVLSIAQIYWQTRLRAEPIAGRYLTLDRGLTADTIGEWGLGFAPDDDTMFLPYMKKQGVTAKELDDAGLTRGVGRYPIFNNRIIYPIHNESGKLVSFAGRVLPGYEGPDPKYLNGPKTILFDKSSILFGFNRARTWAKREGFIVVVEGYQDVIMSHQSGQKNVVAVMGTALTPQHMSMVTPVVNSITLALDPDEAGFGATKRITTKLDLGQLNVSIATLPNGLDPDELAQKGLWAGVINSSEPIDKYYIEAAIEKCDRSSVESKQTLVKELKQLFGVLELSPIKYFHYTNMAASLLGIEESIFIKMVQGSKGQGSKAKAKPVETPQAEDPVLITRYEDLLVAYMVGYTNVALFGQFILRAGKLPMPEEFEQSENQTIYDLIVSIMLDSDARMSFKLLKSLTKDEAVIERLSHYERFVLQEVYLSTDKEVLDTWLNLYERMGEYKLTESITNAKTEDDEWAALENMRLERRKKYGFV